MLSCECSDYDGDYDEWYYSPDDYTTLKTKIRKRCYSCKELINIGSIVGEFERYRSPRSDIEERIHHDEVPLASLYFCEDCIDIYFNLTELGFCVSISGPMKDALKEYKEFLEIPSTDK